MSLPLLCHLTYAILVLAVGSNFSVSFFLLWERRELTKGEMLQIGNLICKKGIFYQKK